MLKDRCGTQSFNFTPAVVGPSRHCFYAYDRWGSVSQTACFNFTILTRMPHQFWISMYHTCL